MADNELRTDGMMLHLKQIQLISKSIIVHLDLYHSL